MKHALYLLISLPLFCSAQTNSESGYRQYGYVDGIRLDSIDAMWADADDAVLAMGGLHQIHFNFRYGQKGVQRKYTVVSDRNGKLITLNSLGAFLNFFDYNGWELFSTYETGDRRFQRLILRKKNSIANK